MAAETLEILSRGRYGDVVLRPDVDAAVSESPVVAGATLIEVTDETTLSAARRLGGDVAALNVASARSPGGGFLTGAQAREENVAFLTAAAPNRVAVERNRPDLLPEVPAALARRAGRVLAIAAAHGHRRLVLGAWGCGVFGNDPAVVADVFAVALRESPWFERVVFAVLDRRPEAPQSTAFARVFGGK